jgi:FkbM family methyltransferase
MSAPPLSLVDFPFDGHSFRLVHVAGDHIPRTIARKGQFYEIDLLRLVSRFHREGELVIDCGANIGNHTLYFARCLGARVLAVEPEPHNFTLLRANLALNAAAGVVAQHFALGKEAGVATLHQCIANNSGSFTASAKRRAAETPAEAGHDVEVPVITLDELLERCRLTVPVSILKLDVEGMEAEILLGAKRLLRLWLPLVAAECASRSELAQVEAALEPWDYYPVEVVNVTPTFVFASRNNAFHANRLKDYLRGSALDRASRNTSFT